MKARPGIVDRIKELIARIGDQADTWLDRMPWRERMPFGRYGEERAARYLGRHGYRIVERNFHAVGAEIDLIAIERDTLVFIEVKARHGDRAGAPAEAVDERKRDRIRRAAAVYAARHRIGARPIRFDVVAISGADHNRRLELLKDAF